MTREEDERATGSLSRVSDLFRQVFADREIISPGTYCAYNAFAGVILLAAAVLMRVEHSFGSARAAAVAAVAGVVLLSAIPVALRRPTAVPTLLAIDGLLFALLAVWLAADGIRWALLPAPRPAFRYLPGLILILFTYGGLQLSGFGPWRVRARQVRIGALIAGLVLDLGVGAVLLGTVLGS